MKNIKKQSILLFVLLLLTLSSTGNVHAISDTSEDTNDKSHLNEWLEGLTPKDTGEVTIRVNKPTKKKSVKNYNLTNNNKNIINPSVDLLPSWMSQESCINGKKGFIFFQSEIVNCENFIVAGAGMNNFSKQFFQEIIIKKKYDFLKAETKGENLAGSDDIMSTSFEKAIKDVSTGLNGELSYISKNIEEAILESIPEGEEGVVNVLLDSNVLGEIVETVEGESDIIKSTGSDIIQAASDSMINTLNNITQDSEDGGVSTEKAVSLGVIDGIVIGDISSSQKLNTQVDVVLKKFLNPDKYIKSIIDESQDKEITDGEDEKVISEEEREVNIEELFPDIRVNSEIDNFTQSLFGPDVNNIMYGASIDNNLLAGISGNYLAIVLENFREDQEIIQIGKNQIFGIKGYPYYNNEIKEMFKKFLMKKPTDDEINRVATNLSAISFSFSTYTNRTVNLKTKNIFKNKLILDFQKLERSYSTISKDTTIRNFLLKR